MTEREREKPPDDRRGRTAVRKLRHDPSQRPFLVIWEVTRACGLVCRHCRADAQHDSHPLQLDTAQGRRLLDDIAAFGPPSPMIVLTGGDPFEREDLADLVAYGRSLGLSMGLAPSVTPRATPERFATMAAAGAKAVSISLDGADPVTHDGFRGIDGVYNARPPRSGVPQRLPADPGRLGQDHAAARDLPRRTDAAVAARPLPTARPLRTVRVQSRLWRLALPCLRDHGLPVR